MEDATKILACDCSGYRYRLGRGWYRVRMAKSPRANAATQARSCGWSDQLHMSGTAVTRVHATVQSGAASRSALDLCGCIRLCAAGWWRRPTRTRSGAARATRSRCSRYWPGPGGQHRGGRALLQVAPSRSTAAVRRNCTGAAMQAHSLCCVDPATPERRCSADMIVLSVRGRVLSYARS